MQAKFRGFRNVSVCLVLILLNIEKTLPKDNHDDYSDFILVKSDIRVITHLDGPIVARNLPLWSEGARGLIITFNSVTYMEDGALCAAPNIQELELDRNSPFPEMHRGTFKNCFNLRRLALRYNDGLTIKPGVFEGLTNLEGLEIKGHVIKQFTSAYFDNTPMLRSLLIWSGGIERIEPSTFAGVRKLEELNLRFNSFHSIDGVLKGLTRLRKLDLEDNHLKSFPWEDLEGATELEELSLRGNPVRHYDALTILKYLKKLKVLNVADHNLPCKDMQKFVEELSIGMQELVVYYLGKSDLYESCEEDDVEE